MEDRELCLRWNEYMPSITTLLGNLLKDQEFVDVTLTADGQNVKCHKLVLSACSPYFQNLFRDNPCQHPVVILRDVSITSLRAAVDYMYNGEVRVNREEVDGVMKAAEALQIRGLTELKTRSLDVKPSGLEVKPLQSIQADRPQSCGSGGGVDAAAYHGALPCKKRRLTNPSPTPSSSSSTYTRDLPPPLPILQDPPPLIGLEPAHLSKEHHATLCRDSSCRSDHRLTGGSGCHEMTGLRGSRSPPNHDMADIRPDILEMIKEEQKAKMMEISQGWMSSSPSSSSPGCSLSYQNQIQSMWQKCWNKNSVFQGLRYRERGPMKSWRPETMAEAIWSVLNEGLSLSQAARKHDIPYPTFVLYANRVHNMLGPSIINGLGGADLRPKGRGRPQRILLGQWPEDHVRHVIRAVVFRDGGAIPSQTPPPGLDTSTPSPQSSSVDPKVAAAALEAQMKSFYNNPFASQLLAASSKMYQHLQESRGGIKQEAADPSYEDADETDAAHAHPDTKPPIGFYRGGEVEERGREDEVGQELHGARREQARGRPAETYPSQHNRGEVNTDMLNPDVILKELPHHHASNNNSPTHEAKL